ncbi:MAG TPA: hypothetical protein VF606_10815, partial [Geminicoccaceae bacterium]
GGNPAYRRGPFVHRGLVSDEHPVLKPFVASTPRASRLWAGDTKAARGVPPPNLVVGHVDGRGRLLGPPPPHG